MALFSAQEKKQANISQPKSPPQLSLALLLYNFSPALCVFKGERRAERAACCDVSASFRGNFVTNFGFISNKGCYLPLWCALATITRPLRGPNSSDTHTHAAMLAIVVPKLKVCGRHNADLLHYGCRVRRAECG
jgi:hypothetical protein